MKNLPFGNHADSILPDGKNWKLVWNDEFDGLELDRSKWNFRLNFWGKRFPAFTDRGVELDGNSNLLLHLVRNDDGSFSSPHLQTAGMTFDKPRDTNGFWPFGEWDEPRFLHRYGYYEIRCRFPRNDGWHSAFWLQAPGIGSHPNPAYGGVECDIMENYRLYTENKMVGGNIWGGYGKNVKGTRHFRWDHVETSSGWHYYGVDWSPSGYAFYADGKLTGRVSPNPEDFAPEYDADGNPCGGVLTGPVSHVEQFVLVSTECHGYRSEGKSCDLLNQAVLPDYFEVDHVRVFDDLNLRPAAACASAPETDDQDKSKPVFMF